MMNATEQSMLPSLLEFYSIPEHFEILKRFRNGEGKLSASILDWFCVNYAKKYGVQYQMYKHGRVRIVHVEQCYHAALNAYNKEYFDPFARGSKRGAKIGIQGADEEVVETTLRQLNYFRWAIDKGVVRYVEEHLDEVYDDMCKRSNRGKKKVGAKKQLTVSATKAMSCQRLKPTS